MMKKNEKFADDIDHEKYESMPIDNFGKEMLYRMGWKDNQPLRANAIVQPIELKPRYQKLGLGAEPLDLIHKKISKYSDEKKLVVNIYGQKIRIINGKHKGLK